MTDTKPNVMEYVSIRNNLLTKQKELYVTAATNINMRYRELLKNDIGTSFCYNCIWDAADMIVDRYFNTRDYYISPQQMYERICFFTYEDKNDALSDATIRKNLQEHYNNKQFLNEINIESLDNSIELFAEKRKGSKLEKQTKDYREKRRKDNSFHDDITGNKTDNLHADHIQSRASIKFDPRYANEKYMEKMRDFYYSDQNFWLIHPSANRSKGDVRVVVDKNGKVDYMSGNEWKTHSKKSELKDITMKATPEQLADATIKMWEKETRNSSKRDKLIEEGYLNEAGNVLAGTRDKLVKAYRNSINAESAQKLMHTNYLKVAKDAKNKTQKSFKKIIIGQAIYYILPPLIFETQTLLKRKNMTIDIFIEEIKKASNRIIKYVKSKMGEILGNVAFNTVNKFFKCFFDIIVELVRETVKRMIKILKQTVISVIDCFKIILDKNSSLAEKADAITKTITITINSIILEILFEWMEAQFGLPDILMEPLQIIVTILMTNLIMLVLQKADLFDLKYGLLIANVENVFEEENQLYVKQSEHLRELGEEEIEKHMEKLKAHINEIQNKISQMNMNEDDVAEKLNDINRIFNMGIDFDGEWKKFRSLELREA